MGVEIALDTPLAKALSADIAPKLSEAGWSSGGADDGALTEYIILMLINGKTQVQIATELASELLGLSPEDPDVHRFAQWLFEHIEELNERFNGSQTTGDPAADTAQNEAAGDQDMDLGSTEVSELNAPTGPRSMRNGAQRGGGRDKRMLGHMSKAMDRSSDPLHHVRGGGRINTHARGPQTGTLRGQGGRQPRNNPRAANIQQGLASGQGWGMQGQGPNQMELVAILEQQNQMMYQLSQQLMSGQNQRGNFSQRGRGKSLFERTGDRNNRRGGHGHQHNGNKQAESEGGDNDMDMSGAPQDATNQDESVCKYNLKCTNKDCKFAHQSPAAPPGVTIDVNDICSFGAACKNRKCVGRHPSPAQKFAHQSEQDCKFYPNCQNPRCPFRHPSMPLCRNGADCTTPNCKFTHVKTKCKFNPCLNPNCAFAHEDGQHGGFKDKVWTAEGEHVSERKFVDGADGQEELVRPEEDNAQPQTETMQDTDDIS